VNAHTYTRRRKRRRRRGGGGGGGGESTSVKNLFSIATAEEEEKIQRR